MENIAKLSIVHPDRFERMVYQPHKDAEFEDDQSDHGYISLAGIIKLQPNRRKGDRTWRPREENDLGDLEEHGSASTGANLHAHETEDIVGSVIQHRFDRSHTRPSATSHAMSTWGHLGMLDGKDTGKDLAFTQVDKQGSRQSEMDNTMAEPYGQVFGKLPDPIRLHEQMGEFDGQVVFIGHPNRDVSAHQWSSSSFEWVNVGRYAHFRGRVEGSLASDRLRGVDEPRDTLGYFKLAAENREALIIQNGRPKNHSSMARHELPTDTDVVVPTHRYEDTSIEASWLSASTKSGSHISLPLTVCAPFRRDALEDPFVAVSNTSVKRTKNDGYVQDNLIGSTGSLDLTYQFPTNASTSTSRLNVGASHVDQKSMQRQTVDVSSDSKLLEVAFGEEAASQRGDRSVSSRRLQGLLSSAPDKPVSSTTRLLSNDEASLPTLPLQDGVAQSTASFAPAARCGLPESSSAPLSYVASKLNAAAVPYARIQTAPTGSGVSESNASTVNGPGVGLDYSDPDGLQRMQRYEVTNGLSQQAPTRQKFKGPFFTETKPTSHDPTVALSVPISEEEKLTSWFRDGHRPGRQKEYTKSLIAAAAAAGGRGQYFGVIGESCGRQAGRFANTGPFVRLYENLSEYAEEYGRGSGQSYFTRRWKPGGLQVRGLGGDDNRSYFQQEKTAPALSRGALLRPWERR
ncbi:hypothetical protein M3J09_003346 [Ascochyta lentis]